MCLIALALGASERFPFVLAANRDEFLERPTAALSLWETRQGASVLSGRDLQAGGIWMGFAPNGRFAMLTNVRQPHVKPPPQPISRGTLALAWLESASNVADFATQLEAHRYEGFNLIVGNARSRQCFYLTNQAFSKPFEHFALIESAQNATDLIVTNMPWGELYSLSNAALESPWPKMLQLKQALRNSLHAADFDALAAQCLQDLADPTPARDTELPGTGVTLALERALSSVFVRHPRNAPRYGTRTSTVAVAHPRGHLTVTEVTHFHNAEPASKVQARLPHWTA